MKRLILLSFFAVISLSAFSSETIKTHKIKWVLAHEPIDLFKEAARVFSEDVTKKTNGRITFEILSLNEYADKYNQSKKISYDDFVKRIQDGSVEMSQTYTTNLGKLSSSLYVLDLPFLFRNHDHAKKVLEGKVGEQLLSSLSSANLHGLAFTYSGGYRVIPGTKKITRVEDFKGMKVRTSSSPIAQDTFKLLGADAVPMALEDIEDGIKSKKIDEAESTYARYYAQGQNQVAKIVNETNHSLFLTSIIMNENFYASLDSADQIIIKDAAIKAARIERDHSIKAGEETKKQCAKEGIEIVTMDKKEQEKLKKALQPIYKKYSPMLSPELISSIQKQ